MPQRLFQHLAIQSFSTEILYSFVIIVCSLMIYYGTKELYELSSHKGIKFFRQAFLFFAFAYFFRSFIKFILFYFNIQGIFLIPSNILNPFIGGLTLSLFVYFSTMAIFYLLFSVVCKKSLCEKKIYYFHVIAIVLSLIVFFFRDPYVYVGLNALLLLFVITSVRASLEKSEKETKNINLYAIYLLLLFFWVLNIIDILIPNFFRGFQMLIYLVSSYLFLLILYKVLRAVGS